MSFLKKLFGLGGGAEEAGEGPGAPRKTVEHNGFLIHATPYKSGGQFQTAGTIEKEVAGVKRTHSFVRADRHATLDDAVEFSLAKGRLIVDQRGERVFDE
jgi:hypothetical protein